VRADTWGHVREGLFHLNSLPRAGDVVAVIGKLQPKIAAKVDDRLPSAVRWLNEFERAWIQRTGRLSSAGTYTALIDAWHRCSPDERRKFMRYIDAEFTHRPTNGAGDGIEGASSFARSRVTSTAAANGTISTSSSWPQLAGTCSISIRSDTWPAQPRRLTK